MINMKELFDICESASEPSQRSIKILNDILSIKSPMDFNEQFATDEELETLISEMECEDLKMLEMRKFKTMFRYAKPKRSDQMRFI